MFFEPCIYQTKWHRTLLPLRIVIYGRLLLIASCRHVFQHEYVPSARNILTWAVYMSNDHLSSARIFLNISARMTIALWLSTYKIITLFNEGGVY